MILKLRLWNSLDVFLHNIVQDKSYYLEFASLLI